MVSIYIVYDLKSNPNNLNPTLKNCWFGAVKLNKDNDINKYKYSAYEIGFDSKGTFHIQMVELVKIPLSLVLI